jgi:glycosyltransferase involved in cell wall biosynthesis
MLRLGLFLPQLPASRGGGFVFESEIYERICGYHGPDPVTFVFIGWESRPEGLPAHVHYVDLSDRSFSERLRTRILFTSWLFTASGRERRKKWMGAYITERIRSEKIDFLWFPTHTVPFTNWPFIATVWDLQHRNSPYYPEVALDGEFERREAHFRDVLTKAAFIVVGTDAGVEEVMRYYGVPERRFWKIPHPTPTRHPAGEKLPEIVPKRPFLFYPAQFWAHKNHITLLRMLQVLETRYHLMFDLVLSGGDKGNLSFVKQQVEAYGLQDRVHFAGFVSRESLQWYYTHAVALTYASLCGPENLPPLEAASLGCPVIAARVPGATEQLGMFAILVDGLSAEEWADAVVELYQDQARRAENIAAGKTRAEAFTGADFVASLVKHASMQLPLRRTWGY